MHMYITHVIHKSLFFCIGINSNNADVMKKALSVV